MHVLKFGNLFLLLSIKFDVVLTKKKSNQLPQSVQLQNIVCNELSSIKSSIASTISKKEAKQILYY